jgi:hypothetical protein
VNLKRRHLDESQRAMVAHRLEGYTHGGDRKNQDANLHLDRKQAAEMLNVGVRSIATAAKIKREAPEPIVEAAKAGTVSGYKGPGAVFWPGPYPSYSPAPKNRL